MSKYWINHYSADECYQNLSYSVDSDFSNGYHGPSFEQLGPGLVKCIRLLSRSIKF